MSGNFWLQEQPTFSLQNALCLARSSELAYLEQEELIVQLSRFWDFTEFQFFQDDGTQCFVAADDRSIVVSFRGTESDQLQDWVSDARTTLVAGPLNGEVHAGFYDALSKVWRVMDDHVCHLLRLAPRKLFVTGHSLGAALATLAVAKWIESQTPVTSLYTFGQPRTGSDQFARNFNFAMRPHAFRFVNNNDLVTRIPPRAFGYSHLGSFKYFTADGEFRQEISWWNRFLDSWKGRLQDVFDGGDNALEDHSMTTYRLRIGRTHKLLHEDWQFHADESFQQFVQQACGGHFGENEALRPAA